MVALLDDDDANAAALRLAQERGVQRLVARPADPGYNGTYSSIDDVLVVDPATAIVSLLEQAVTSPQSATLLLRQDAERLVTQFRITNPDLDGTPVRQLRLPSDVLLLQLTREGTTVLVAGHTTLRLGDEVMVLGAPDSLTEASVRLTT